MVDVYVNHALKSHRALKSNLHWLIGIGWFTRASQQLDHLQLCGNQWPTHAALHFLLLICARSSSLHYPNLLLFCYILIFFILPLRFDIHVCVY